MLDWNRVAELREEVGEDAFDEVVEMFLEEVEEVFGELKAKVATLDLPNQMHFLRGSALNLGFADLANLCFEAEVQAQRSGCEAVDIGLILTAFDASKIILIDGLQTRFAA